MTRDEFNDLKVGDWVYEREEFPLRVIDIERSPHDYANVKIKSIDNKCSYWIEHTSLHLLTKLHTEPTPPPSDHYKRLGLEPWHIGAKWYTLEQLWCYFSLNAIAYLGRAPERGGYIENAKKAIEHLQEYVRLAEAQQDQPEGTL